MHVGGARFPNIDIQANLACEFQLHPRITSAQLIFKRACQLVNLRHKRLDGTAGRSESHQNKRSPAPAQKNRIAQLEIGHHSGNAGLLSEFCHDGFQRLATFGGIRRWEPLGHQDNPVHERRVETSGQLVPHSFSLAPFDAGCGLQAALGVKRERKKCDGCCEDDPRHPKSARVHSFHDVISNKIVVTKTLCWRLRTTGAKKMLCGEPLGAIALGCASLHLRTTHARSYLNLLNFLSSIQQRSRRIYSYFIFARTACRHATGGGRPSPWLLDADLGAVESGSSEPALHNPTA